MKPLGQNILIKPLEADEVSEGGLLIPENARKESNKVYIVNVGDGSPSLPMKLKAGQIGYRVKGYTGRYGEILIHGEKYYLVEQSAILATQ